MAFCSISKELSATAHTQIENIFLFEYMPDFSGETVKVYLYGLYLCTTSPKNYSIKDMATALKCSEEQIQEHFRVLEDAGLVDVTEGEEFEVTYLPITASRPKKFKPEKYTDFTLALQSILPDRMVSVAECRAYFTLMESYNLKPDALLLIIRYCVDKKGASTSYKYVLAKAKDFAERGLLTAEAVENELSDYFKNSDAIDGVLKKLGLKRKAELSDLKFYEKWINDLGFPPESILIAAGKIKGDLKKLDGVLLELCGAKAFTKKEIDEFFKQREELAVLARETCRSLSVYVEVIDPVVSTYVAPWTSLGYDRASILALAKYCFKRGKRTLAALDELISRLYAKGVVSLTSILAYVEESKRVEGVLTQMLQAAGIDRKVTPWDKENYTVWKDKWNFSDEMILYVAGLSAGKSNPIPYLNAVLSALKAEGVYTVEEAQKKRLTAPASKPAQAASNFDQRTYSEEELDRIFAGSDTELL
ncbi:MAG: DnaD domain protein [Clostridia bacterium]|nr:DnaD domain protein [Clostridia bacterium]MBQ5802375.1 DnaD domain protein [Clostridia bacterium]